MARKRSPETELRRLKRDMQSLQRDYQGMRSARLAAVNAINLYRVACEKAEKEAAEWKKRFDALLLKVPDVPKEPT